MLVTIPASWSGAYDFACNSPACAPPPVGKGGSIKGKAAPLRRQAKRAAERIYKDARSASTAVTPLVSDLILGAGGSMEGLSNRLKTVDSLERKIYNKANERGQTIAQSADRISDALRYTGVLKDPPPGNYARTIKSIIKRMEGEGMSVVELETHWRRGDAYNGVHLIAKHPNGTKVEIQFHTPRSLKAKGITHEMYEKWRLPETPGPERVRLAREMVKVADQAPIPAGSLGLGVQVYRPVE